jgi:hypothetical protein
MFEKKKKEKKRKKNFIFHVEVSSSLIKLKLVNKIEKCYVFETKNDKKFVAWWTTIKWSYNNKKKLIKIKQKIRRNSKKKSFHWKQFYERTTITKDYSKIIC